MDTLWRGERFPGAAAALDFVTALHGQGRGAFRVRGRPGPGPPQEGVVQACGTGAAPPSLGNSLRGRAVTDSNLG